MIRILNKSKEKLCFVSDISAELANSIRRASLEIPILAIDEVEISKNDSALFDESLSHRLGLIPLKTEKTFTEPSKCSCKGKGCMKCKAELKLKSVGEKIVYAEEMKGKAGIVYGKMPIVFLKKGQEMELVAIARLGIGKDHAKYSPGIVYYRHVNDLENLKDLESLRKNLIEVKEKFYLLEKRKDKNSYITDIDDGALESCNSQGYHFSQGREIVFFIESFGQIDSKDIFLASISAIKKNLNELKKLIK